MRLLVVDSGAAADCGGRRGRAPRWLYAKVPVAAALLICVALASSEHQRSALRSNKAQSEFEVLDEAQGEQALEGGKPNVVPDADMMFQSDVMKKVMEEQAGFAESEQKLANRQRAEENEQEQKAKEAKEKSEKKERDEEAARKAAAKKKAGEAAKQAENKQKEEEKRHRAAEQPEERKPMSNAARSMLLGALDDLMEGPPTTPAPLKTKAHGFEILSNSTCYQKGLFPISHSSICSRAASELLLDDNASSVTNGTSHPEGCYFFKGKLWFAENEHNQGHGASDDRRQICMTKARKHHEDEQLEKLLGKQAEEKAAVEKRHKEELKKEQEELKKEREERKERREKEKRERAEQKLQKHLDKEERVVQSWENDEKTVPNVTLYCFSLMMPFGYEPGLLHEQKLRGVGIYACDEAVVFSNTTTLMSGEPSPVEVSLIPGSLAVAYGGRWMTALNTGVFNRLWMEVIRLGRYRYHDWVVKVDPDSVFFPSRLRELIRHKSPYNEQQVQRRVEEPNELRCGNCRLNGKEHETCASHVRFWQQNGHTCKKALELTSRDAPTDCGCDCDDFACDLPGSAMYLNNCKWGLHGPIEVLSRRAVATYAAGLPKCVGLLEHPWGEDKFLDQCMQELGVTRANEYSLLSETACGEQPAPCGTSNVAFHPFKSIQSYFTCYEYANKYGMGPASPPVFPDLEDAQGGGMGDIMMKYQEHSI